MSDELRTLLRAAAPTDVRDVDPSAIHGTRVQRDRRRGVVAVVVAALAGAVVLQLPRTGQPVAPIVDQPPVEQRTEAPTEELEETPAGEDAEVGLLGLTVVPWPEGPSQTMASAAAQRIPTTVAALPLADRVGVRGGVQSEDGLWITSRPAVADGAVDRSGEQYVDWVDDSYGELLLLDAATLEVLHAWPMNAEMADGELVLTDDAVVLAAGSDSRGVGGTLARVDRTSFELDVLVLPSVGSDGDSVMAQPYPWFRYARDQQGAPGSPMWVDGRLLSLGDVVLERDPTTLEVTARLHDAPTLSLSNGQVVPDRLMADPAGTVHAFSGGDGTLLRPLSLDSVEPAVAVGAETFAVHATRDAFVAHGRMPFTELRRVDVVGSDGALRGQHLLGESSASLHSVGDDVLLVDGSRLSLVHEDGSVRGLGERQDDAWTPSVVLAGDAGSLRWLVGSTVYEVPATAVSAVRADTGSSPARLDLDRLLHELLRPSHLARGIAGETLTPGAADDGDDVATMSVELATGERIDLQLLGSTANSGIPPLWAEFDDWTPQVVLRWKLRIAEYHYHDAAPDTPLSLGATLDCRGFSLSAAVADDASASLDLADQRAIVEPFLRSVADRSICSDLGEGT